MMVGGRDFTPGPHGPNWVACSALGEGAVLKTEGMASREGPQRSASVRFCASRFHDCLPLSAGIRYVDCLLGCQQSESAK